MKVLKTSVINATYIRIQGENHYLPPIDSLRNLCYIISETTPRCTLIVPVRKNQSSGGPRTRPKVAKAWRGQVRTQVRLLSPWSHLTLRLFRAPVSQHETLTCSPILNKELTEAWIALQRKLKTADGAWVPLHNDDKNQCVQGRSWVSAPVFSRFELGLSDPQELISRDSV